MKSASRRPPSASEHALWRRQDTEDQARWEARLRQMSTHATRYDRPVVASPPENARRALEIVGGMMRHDVLLISRSLPLFSGSEPEDLTCGNCSDVIGSQISLQSARSRHPEGVRLLARCTCGALNLLFQPQRCRSAGARGKRSVAASVHSKHEWRPLRHHGRPRPIAGAHTLERPTRARAADRSPSSGR